MPAASDAAGGLPYELRRAVERAPVVLYSAPDCQPCVPAAALLRERGVPFTERSVTTTDDLQEFRSLTGGLRLPHVTVGTISQNGFHPEVWHSLLDAAASLINLLAVRHALTPADREHRFGHGKAEPMAAIVVAVVLVGAANVGLVDQEGKVLKHTLLPALLLTGVTGLLVWWLT